MPETTARTIRIAASHNLLVELTAARAALKRSRSTAAISSPLLDSLLIQIHTALPAMSASDPVTGAELPAASD